MKNWLKSVRPPKYLRYLFFIAYSWYRRYTSERSDAHFTAIVFLSMIHMIVYEAIYLFVFQPKSKVSILVVIGLVSIQSYFWFWHKEKWKLFLTEFQHINRKQQLLGGVYLFLYLFTCLIFFILPIFLGEVFGLRLEKIFE